MAHKSIGAKVTGSARRSVAQLGEAWQVWKELQQGKRTTLPRFANSVALILGRVASSGLGFLTWLITARLFAPAEVGIASGVVSAMMLCVQLALLGIGAAVIKLYPEHESRPARLLDSSLNLVSAAALVASGLFLLLASVAFRELSVVAATPLYTLLFLAMTLFGAVNVLLDNVSIAMRRNDQVFVRNVLFGIITISLVAALPLLLGAADSISIVFAWALAGFGACALGAVQLWRSLSHYFYRPQINLGIGRRLVRVGLPNYLLTLTERAPNWVIPIIVTELLSPVDNAHWYTVWMMAWVVFIVPISVGQNLFAEASRRPDAIREALRHSTRTSLLLGGLAAGGIALFAPLILSLLGPGYAAAGVTPLRILVLAVVPVIYIQNYYAICRARSKLLEATLTGITSGTASVVAAIAVGPVYGLTGMALSWLITQSLVSLWAIWRLRRLMRSAEAASSQLSSIPGNGQNEINLLTEM